MTFHHYLDFALLTWLALLKNTFWLNLVMKSFLERFAWLQIKRKNTFNQIDRHLRSSNLSSKKLLADLTDLLALLEAKSMEFPTDSSQWLPYKLRLERSGIENAGLGVHLEGMIEKGSIVALYPGTIYHPGDPLFLSSLRNAYILRCFDGLFVDGKHFGLSASVFESMYKFHCGCCGEVVADNSWLKHSKTMVKNPLAVGQIINNGTLKFPANGKLAF